jgi:hypothetical protein
LVAAVASGAPFAQARKSTECARSSRIAKATIDGLTVL